MFMLDASSSQAIVSVTDAAQNAWLDYLIKGIVVVLLGMVSFGFRKFFSDMAARDKVVDARDQSLQDSIDGLKDAVAALSEKFVLKTDYTRDIQDLRERRAAERAEAANRVSLNTDDVDTLKTLLAAMRSGRPA